MEYTPISTREEVNLLATNIDRLHYRLKYTEMLHRKVGDDADIHKYPTMIPQIMAYSAGGAAVALSFVYLWHKFLKN